MIELYDKTGSFTLEKEQQKAPAPPNETPLERMKPFTVVQKMESQKTRARKRMSRTSPIKRVPSKSSRAKLSKSSPLQTAPTVEEDPYAFPDESSSDTVGRSTQSPILPLRQNQRRDASKFHWDKNTPVKNRGKRTYGKPRRSH